MNEGIAYKSMDNFLNSPKDSTCCRRKVSLQTTKKTLC